MATLPEAGGYTPQRQSTAPQPQIHDLDEVAGALPDSKPPHVAQVESLWTDSMTNRW